MLFLIEKRQGGEILAEQKTRENEVLNMEDFIDISKGRHSWAWKCFKKDKKSERALCNFCGVILDCKHGTHGMLTHLRGTHAIIDASQIPTGENFREIDFTKKSGNNDLMSADKIITSQPIVDFKNDIKESRVQKENIIEEKITEDNIDFTKLIKSEHDIDNNGEILLDTGNGNGDQQIQNKISIEHLSAILETYSELMDLLDQDPDVQRGLNAKQKLESALQSYREMSSEENNDLNDIES